MFTSVTKMNVIPKKLNFSSVGKKHSVKSRLKRHI